MFDLFYSLFETSRVIWMVTSDWLISSESVYNAHYNHSGRHFIWEILTVVSWISFICFDK